MRSLDNHVAKHNEKLGDYALIICVLKSIFPPQQYANYEEPGGMNYRNAGD